MCSKYPNLFENSGINFTIFSFFPFDYQSGMKNELINIFFNHPFDHYDID